MTPLTLASHLVQYAFDSRPNVISRRRVKCQCRLAGLKLGGQPPRIEAVLGIRIRVLGRRIRGLVEGSPASTRRLNLVSACEPDPDRYV